MGQPIVHSYIVSSASHDLPNSPKAGIDVVHCLGRSPKFEPGAGQNSLF